MSLVWSLVAAVLYGSSDFTGAFATRRAQVLAVVVWSHVAGILTALALVPVFGGSSMSGGDVVWASAAGLAGAVGLVALYQGLATQPVGVVAPISAVVTASIPALVGGMAGERIGWQAWVGVVLALIAIWLVSADRGGSPATPAALAFGVAAGVSFGLFFVFIARTASDTGMRPLVVMRLASIIGLTAAAFATRRGLRAPRRAVPPTIGAGVVDMAANAAFLLAVRSGLLTIASVVSSLYPAVTVLLARLIFTEHLGRRRIGGLALAIVAVAAIGVGR